METAAENLLTGEVTPDTRSEEQKKLLEHLATAGNNGWHDDLSKTTLPGRLAKLRASGLPPEVIWARCSPVVPASAASGSCSATLRRHSSIPDLQPRVPGRLGPLSGYAYLRACRHWDQLISHGFQQGPPVAAPTRPPAGPTTQNQDHHHAKYPSSQAALASAWSASAALPAATHIHTSRANWEQPAESKSAIFP